MNYIAIDTSSKNLIIVVCKKGEIFSFFDKDCGVKHSDKIMVELENLIAQSNIDLSTLDFIACVTGAGSFTGIRIAISTVKALCYALNLPHLSVTAFDTLAYNKQSGKFLAVIDAGHDGFYVCGYNDGEVELEPCYVMKEKLIELSKNYKILSQTQLKDVEAELVNPLLGLVNAIENKKLLVDSNADNLIPLYVRKSQAEEGRL